MQPAPFSVDAGAHQTIHKQALPCIADSQADRLRGGVHFRHNVHVCCLRLLALSRPFHYV